MYSNLISSPHIILYRCISLSRSHIFFSFLLLFFPFYFFYFFPFLSLSFFSFVSTLFLLFSLFSLLSSLSSISLFYSLYIFLPDFFPLPPSTSTSLLLSPLFLSSHGQSIPIDHHLNPPPHWSRIEPDYHGSPSLSFLILSAFITGVHHLDRLSLPISSSLPTSLWPPTLTTTTCPSSPSLSPPFEAPYFLKNRTKPPLRAAHGCPLGAPSSNPYGRP